MARAENDNFRNIWLASAISQLGDGAMLVAIPLVAAKLTGSAGQVAAITVAETLPLVLFSLLGGALVDRMDRRRVMIWADAGRAIAMGILAIAIGNGFASMPLLYAAAFLMGVGESLIDPASQAILPMIVPGDELERANSRLSSTQALSFEFAGPPLGGLLFGLSAAAPFFLNTISFLGAIALVLAVRGGFRANADATGEPSAIRAEIREGATWLWRHRTLRTLAIVQGAMNALFIAAMSIFVLLAVTVLHTGDLGFGLMMSAGALGGVLGSLAVPKLSAAVGGRATIIASIVATGVAFAGIGLVTQPLFTGALFMVVSASAAANMVVIASLRMRLVPNHLLGRVTSASRMVSLGGLPIGAVVGGVLASAVGVDGVFLCSGFAMVVVAVFAAISLRNESVAAVYTEAAATIPPTAGALAS